jgi:enoyl-CoA hydratase/carnithine racemase
MSTTAGAVRRELADGILTVTLARAAKLNALTPAMVEELAVALAAAAHPAVHVVLLAGEGRAFCAGADVGESLGIDDQDRADAFLRALAGVLSAISKLPKPVVAAVQGHAVGGGAELALEADLRVVADDAVLGFPDVALGSTPASLYQLFRMVGRSRALEMAMLGTQVDAAEMQRLGIANRVVARADLGDAALALARELRDRAPARSLRYAKEAVMHADVATREAELAANVNAMLACYASDEQRRYVDGFGDRP